MTEAEIGGLSVEAFRGEISTGRLAVDISEPSYPMERFEIDARQSTIAARKLGNASPRELKIETTMGGAEIDLGGAWRRDASIRLEAERAGGTLRLPEEANVEGIECGFKAPSHQEIPRPTLHFAVESTIGRFQIENP